MGVIPAAIGEKLSHRSYKHKLSMKLKRVCLIGPQGSGKTQLAAALSGKPASEKREVVNFVNIVKGDVKVQLWDLSGDPRYESIVEAYYNRCDLFVLVLDEPNDDAVAKYTSMVRRINNDSPIEVVVGLDVDDGEAVDRLKEIVTSE